MSDLIRAAIAGVDEVAVAIEGKWGVGQLSRKAAAIDPPLAVRFKLQKRKFDDAIAINGKAKTIKDCEAKNHGWQFGGILPLKSRPRLTQFTAHRSGRKLPRLSLA